MRSLRVRLGVIFLSFLLLASGSAAATFLAVHTRADDAIVINLAGRQRMLVQQTALVQWIQVIFLVGTLLAVVAGLAMIQRLVVHRMERLAAAAERIGRGDLTTSIPIQGSREIQMLAQSLDMMRNQLQAVQATLKTWEEELDARVAQQTQALVSLHEISRDISSHLDINMILQSVTDKAKELLGGDTAAVCLPDMTEQRMNLQSVSEPKEALSGSQAPMQESSADRIQQDGALIGQNVCCPGPCRTLAAAVRISHIAAPLQAGERVIGVLCVGSQKPNAFSADSASLLAKLANIAAVALENARLYRQAERLAMLEERQRIATEMHDGLAQTLSYLGLKTEQAAERVEAGRCQEALDTLQVMREAMTRALQEVRQGIADLQKDTLPPCDLQDRLAGLAQEIRANNGPAVDLLVMPRSPLLLPAAHSDQVLPVVREALLNACRHSQAEHITVRLEQHEAEVIVTVEDDGQGFDPQAPRADSSGHFGLNIMRARAARLGGRLTIHSRPGHGTQVSLAWPLNDERRTTNSE